MKWLLVCDAQKRIRFLSAAYPGHTHDFAIFKKLFAGLDFSDRSVHVDLGFIGIQKNITGGTIHIPHKGTKKNPLTQDQKDQNKALSQIRVIVENAIAKMKSFFILRIENRMKIKQKFNETIGICAELANLKTKLA